MIDIDRLCWIAKIELDSKEKEKIKKDIEKILEFFEVVKEMDVSIEMCKSLVFKNFPEKSLRKFEEEKIIINFPKREGKYLEVPIFLK